VTFSILSSTLGERRRHLGRSRPVGARTPVPDSTPSRGWTFAVCCVLVHPLLSRHSGVVLRMTGWAGRWPFQLPLALPAPKGARPRLFPLQNCRWTDGPLVADIRNRLTHPSDGCQVPPPPCLRYSRRPDGGGSAGHPAPENRAGGDAFVPPSISRFRGIRRGRQPTTAGRSWIPTFCAKGFAGPRSWRFTGDLAGDSRPHRMHSTRSLVPTRHLPDCFSCRRRDHRGAFDISPGTRSR